jgi:hypothetical protein
MAGSDEDHGKSRRLGAEDQGWSSIVRVLGGWVIGRCHVWSAPCTWRWGARVSWLSLKMKGEGFPVWASKLATLVWWFGPQNHSVGFLVWASKPSRLRFVGCARKRMGGWFDMGHTSRSSGLLRLEASCTRISQSGLKIGRGTTAGGACGIITEVVWKWTEIWSARWRRVRRSGSWTKM